MKTKITATPVAKSVPFDNTTPGATGMVSTEVQSAIEEIREDSGTLCGILLTTGAGLIFSNDLCLLTKNEG